MSEDRKVTVPKTAIDLQKLKLEKLMTNPDKPVIIPERPKGKKNMSVPEFVRNVMGSSAGAGSGEFHVYRHLRRKEYSRQKLIDEMAHREALDKAFEDKLIESKRKMEEKASKNRAKRKRFFCMTLNCKERLTGHTFIFCMSEFIWKMMFVRRLKRKEKLKLKRKAKKVKSEEKDEKTEETEDSSDDLSDLEEGCSDARSPESEDVDSEKKQPEDVSCS